MDQPHLATIVLLWWGAIGVGTGGSGQQPNLEATADFPAETRLPRAQSDPGTALSSDHKIAVGAPLRFMNDKVS